MMAFAVFLVGGGILWAVLSKRTEQTSMDKLEAQTQGHEALREELERKYEEIDSFLGTCDEDLQARFRPELDAAMERLVNSSGPPELSANEVYKAQEAFQRAAEAQQRELDTLRDLHDRIARAKAN